MTGKSMTHHILSLWGIIIINMQNSLKKESLELGIIMKELKGTLNYWEPD